MNRPIIGAFVLETLTTGMYTNPLDCLREFVQNSTDSLMTAERTGILEKGRGLITVSVDPMKRILEVCDNGIGVCQDEVQPRLIDIATSRKSVDMDAGFRGIGRLAAVAYCETLQFETTCLGESTATLVSFDCKGLRDALVPGQASTEEVSSLVERHTKVSTVKCKTNEHFFRVRMIGIDENYDEFLDWTALKNYLSQVAPVPFDAQRFVYGPVIQEWLTRHGIDLPTVHLIIEAPPHVRYQVFKPYRTRYKTSRNDYPVEISDVIFYPENPSPDQGFFIWYGKSDLPGVIEDGMSAGFRIRKNNIALGGSEQMEAMFESIAKSNGRFCNYFIGEVHVLSSETIPNARRDALEDRGRWPDIRRQILEFVRARSADIREQSKNRNLPVAKVMYRIEAVASKAENLLNVGAASRAELNSTIARVDSEIERTKEALKSTRSEGARTEIEKGLSELEQVSSRLKRECTYTSDKLNPRLSRKERKLVGEALEIVYEHLCETNCPQAEACFTSLKAAVLAHFSGGAKDGKK